MTPPLISVYGNDTVGEKCALTHISWIEIGTSLLSAVSSIYAMLHILFTNRRNLAKLHFYLQFALANILVSAAILVTAILSVTNTFHKSICVFSHLTVSLFLLMFFLRIVFSLNNYNCMKEKLARSSLGFNGVKLHAYEKLLNVLAWCFGITIVVVTTSLCVECPCTFGPNSMSVVFFSLSDAANISEDCFVYQFWDVWLIAKNWTFVSLFFLVVLVTAVLDCCVFRIHHKIHQNRGVYGYLQIRAEASKKYRALLAQFTFVFCWWPSVVLALLTVGDLRHDIIIIFAYFQALLVPLQGFIDALWYQSQVSTLQFLPEQATLLTSSNSVME